MLLFSCLNVNFSGVATFLEIAAWLTICSLCILTICNFGYFPFLRADFGF